MTPPPAVNGAGRPRYATGMTGMFKTAKYVGLGWALALAAGTLSLAPWDEPLALLATPFLYAWLVGPGLFAAACVRLSNSGEGAAWFLAVQVGIALWTAWSWYDLTIVHPHSMNGIGLGIIIPFWQYLIVGAAWLAALALGWRRRQDWP